MITSENIQLVESKLKNEKLNKNLLKLVEDGEYNFDNTDEVNDDDNFESKDDDNDVIN